MRNLLSGFDGANNDSLAEWIQLPLNINEILRNDLRTLRARCRDLARNDDTTKRFLGLADQNIIGPQGVRLQCRNRDDNNVLDKGRNKHIENEFSLYSKKRRKRGHSYAMSACGTMGRRAFARLALLSKIIDGEYFIQILRGYKHNPHKIAFRFIDPDLIDANYDKELSNGNRIVMGVELDEFDRAVNYHLDGEDSDKVIIPAEQIIHVFKKEYPGQVRGIPRFAVIIPKTKMLHGVNEAIVIGWRIAAAKMGFFSVSDPEFFEKEESVGAAGEKSFDDRRKDGDFTLNANPGTFDALPEGFGDLKLFDPDYPTSTYEQGHNVFMRQIANGVNISSPTLSNNPTSLSYSALRHITTADQDMWRCEQSDHIEEFEQPIFDEWYDWSLEVTGKIKLSRSQKEDEPVTKWLPRGFVLFDPYKDIKAYKEANESNARSLARIIADTTGEDFAETIEELADERKALIAAGLLGKNEGNNGK